MRAVIDLYGMSSPNVFKISIMLEEVGLPWRIKHINVFKGDQYTQEFLSLSPNNKVPLLFDPDGPEGKPHSVFESGAILIYLADKTGKFLASEPRVRSIQLQWLMMQMGSIGPMFGQLMHFIRYNPPGSDYPLERYTSEMRRILDVLEARLSQSSFLGGEEYSIADMAVFPWMRVPVAYIPPFKGRDLVEAYDRYPSISAWLHTLLERPALQRGLEALETSVRPKDLSAFHAATEDEIDRFLGRGKFARK
jgi:GST-like protein